MHFQRFRYPQVARQLSVVAFARPRPARARNRATSGPARASRRAEQPRRGSIAFVVDPDLRCRGLGRALITAVTHQRELRFVQLFEAGVEPDDAASGKCLDAAGFRVGSAQPDFEGMFYYHVRRAELDQNAKLQA